MARISKKSTLPTGQERMKRRPPTDLSLRPHKIEFDPKQAYSAEQLAEIGAIALRTNQIEAHIDFIGSHILFSTTPFWLQIATDNALGLKAKLALLRECYERSTLLDDKAKNCIKDCFDEVLQCRNYRNAVIHHHIYDHSQGIGAYVDHAKESHQILVSLDALTTLYKIMCSLLDEVREVDMLFRLMTDAQRPGKWDEKAGVIKPFDDDYLKANIIPHHVERLMKLQRERKELHKLPHFPDADLIKSFNEREGGVGE
ncbi:hypothetical protein ACKWRH_26270 [Bradyrhizobium sp. Pa8]|uniref:hypothetical protein n=1 Tax=Bradyrhizobium sp. Pa8 TaxID=3386552 RepID=UPI00403FBB55